MNAPAPLLEILQSRPSGNARSRPVLFVHGAFTGAWIWNEHFLPYFAQQGYSAFAVSLRGHGGSEGADTLHLASIDDYVQDVEQAIATIGEEPILVGHSMGAAVAQRCVDHVSPPALVLMASVPPTGMLMPTLSMMVREPKLFAELNLLQHLHPCFISVESTRRALFSDEIPDELVARCFARTRVESHRAILDLMWPSIHLAPRRPQESPPLVLGAGADVIFPPTVVEATARYFDTDAKIFPGLGHAMMLETRWRQVADHILEWLAVRGL